MTVIEISGGVLVGVYSDGPEDDVMLLDWDDYRADEENYAPASVGSMTLDQMPAETKALFDQ
jgi:hypothetical protein